MEFTETGKMVYDRTYSRVYADGSKEEWADTVDRVVRGNFDLGDARHELTAERAKMRQLMQNFQVIPAGRHLWASGVRGRQYLFNCWNSGWTGNPLDHFEFTFLRLMEGGGVGANYGNRHLALYPYIHGPHEVHIVCDNEHPDYQKMLDAGLLSEEYAPDWGCFEVEDSREGWAEALNDLLGTYYRPARHYNRVFDVSRVRSESTRLKTFGGRASGPLPLARMLHEVSEVMNELSYEHLDGMSAMEIDHAIAKCVVSGGNRRSARMSIMPWNDPQIGEFLRCKQGEGAHWTTNISVEVDETFWYHVENNHDSQASRILGMISRGMHRNGEPGFWDSDYSNEGEPNPVTSTNPCSEIPLEPWEPCNLGHINLAAFVEPYTGAVDYEQMSLAHRLMTRFLIRATNGDINDPKAREVLDRNRRIGVGHLGVASFLALTGRRYDRPGARFSELLTWLAEIVDEEAAQYANQLRVPKPVKMRTVAPTGTIAKMPGVSEGIHPIFSKYFIRRIRLSTVDPSQTGIASEYMHQGYKVEDCQYAPATVVVEIPTKDSLMDDVARIYGEAFADEVVVGADEISVESMLNMQGLYQALWADNAVSYTANFDPEHYTSAEIYELLAEKGPGLKGVTIFPEMGMPQSPYERITKEQYEMSLVQEAGDGVDENCVSGACPVR